MEGNFVTRFFSKLKDKINNDKKSDVELDNLYSFNDEEIKDLTRQNKEKIKELKKNVIPDKVVEVTKDEQCDNLVEEFLDKEMGQEIPEESYVDITPEKMNVIMEKWSSIDREDLNKDISEGKDILTRSNTITFGDEALAYIYRIREEYNVIIEYLIGFNNEKKGVKKKVIFSDRLEDEWRYLDNYVRVMEKIRDTLNQKK